MGCCCPHKEVETGDDSEAQPLLRRVVSTAKRVQESCFTELHKLWHGRAFDFPAIVLPETGTVLLMDDSG